MRYIFSYATTFNQDISQWDVSRVASMDWMFGSAVAFNQDLSQWDVSQVTSMNWMFAYATSSQYAFCWNLDPSVSTENVFIGTQNDGFGCSS